MWYTLNADKSVKCGFNFKTNVGPNEELIESNDKPVIGYNKKLYLPDYLPDPEIDYYKAQKKKELSNEFNKVTEKAHLLSSLGFEIDANETANRNINGLITTGNEPVSFCDYNNQFHELSINDLKVMLNEIILNGQNLYAKKWMYRNQIDNSESIEEVNAMVFEF